MSSERLCAVLSPDLSGLRLDRALAEVFQGHSRSRIQRSILEGHVLVDARPADASQRVAGGERVEWSMPAAPDGGWEPDPVTIRPVYEDSEIIVIDKPAGLVVHPGAGNRTHTLANGLLHRYPELARLPRAGVVHRLDKDTSGLLVVARSDAAHRHLVSELLRRAVEREYDAVVWGRLSSDCGRIDAPIARHRRHRTRMAVAARGRNAITHYRVRARYPHFTRLRVRLETGRTHQIRVHMHHLGHPLAGDPVYGARRRRPDLPLSLQKALRELEGQALHADRLAFSHPLDDVRREWHATLPADFAALIATLEATRGAQPPSR